MLATKKSFAKPHSVCLLFETSSECFNFVCSVLMKIVTLVNTANVHFYRSEHDGIEQFEIDRLSLFPLATLYPSRLKELGLNRVLLLLKQLLKPVDHGS